MAKFGERNYDMNRFLQRGLHEIGNSLFPESTIPLRDHSGLYAEPKAPESTPKELNEPEIEL